MPSKWQSLPTEQINPASLAIDKAPVRDIIDPEERLRQFFHGFLDLPENQRGTDGYR